MNTPRSQSADIGNLRNDPRYASLFATGPAAYLPRTNAKGRKGIQDLDLHVILLPSNLGSARSGTSDTATGPAYVWQALEPVLRAGGANVTSETIPVQKIVKGVTPSGPENVRNAAKIVTLMRHTMERVYQAIVAHKQPIVLGGDHTSLIAAGGALMAHPDPQDSRYSTMKLVLVDGDKDSLREPTEPGVWNAHGRTVSTLQGVGPLALRPVMDGIPLLRPQHTLVIGGFRPDPEEVPSAGNPDCLHVGPDALAGMPELVGRFLQQFLGEGPYHWSFDPDVLSKLFLMTRQGKGDRPGAPMATLEGVSVGTLFRVCWLLGNVGKPPASLDMAELAAACDRKQGGLTRAITIGAMARVLGMGKDPEYYFDYDPHGA